MNVVRKNRQPKPIRRAKNAPRQIPRTREEFLKLPKGEFGRAISAYRQEQKLPYAQIIPLVRDRIGEALTKSEWEHFDKICHRVTNWESGQYSRKGLNSKEFQKARRDFWKFVEEHA